MAVRHFTLTLVLLATIAVACTGGSGNAGPGPTLIPEGASPVGLTPEPAPTSTRKPSLSPEPKKPAAALTPSPARTPTPPQLVGLPSLAAVTPGTIITVAGAGHIGDGAPATSAGLSFPWGVAVDRAGNLFIADTPNNRIRRVDAVTGLITTMAGTGDSGFSGDRGPATRAQLSQPKGVAVDDADNLFIADSENHRIRAVKAPLSESNR